MTENLGQIAPASPIVEADFGEVMRSMAVAERQRGDFKVWIGRQQQHVYAYIQRPKGITLPASVLFRQHWVDMSLQISQEIRDADGRVMVPAGTRINPLHYLHYGKVLCFINGDDPEQVKWSVRSCPDRVRDRLILVEGNLMKISHESSRRWYFDQYGVLSRRFSLRSVPAKVYQQGEAMLVTEEPASGGGRRELP
ncbi:MAG: hypothetical protein HKM02_00495 [Pseudomonadales bacterium]|nr:hypothetical protein [Pseudomonadales bacterium]